MLLVYYSSNTNNTKNFVEHLQYQNKRIPISFKDDPLIVDVPFILVTPTYADRAGKGAVPKQVIRFLNNEVNRSNIKAVISGGNRNFGEMFGVAADVVSYKCEVPILYKFELRGTTTEFETAQKIIEEFRIENE